MAAAMLAALFAMGVFSPTGVAADAPTFQNLNLDIVSKGGTAESPTYDLINTNAAVATNIRNPDGVDDAYQWFIDENSTSPVFEGISVNHTEAFTYSIDATATGLGFAINRSDGTLRYSGHPTTPDPDYFDYENSELDESDSTGGPFSYDPASPTVDLANVRDEIDGKQRIAIVVTATVSNAAPHTDPDAASVILIVTVNDVDDKPAFRTTSGGNVASTAYTGAIRENLDSRSSVGKVYATDQDGENDDITFSLDQASMDLGFSLSAARGGTEETAGSPNHAREATIAYQRPDGAPQLNYEEFGDPTKAIEITVTATSGSSSSMVKMTVSVTNQPAEKPDKPGAPTLMYFRDSDTMPTTCKTSGDANGTCLGVRWTAPDNAGGPIFQYVLEIKEESKPDSTFSPATMVYDSEGMRIVPDKADTPADSTTTPPTPENAASREAGDENLLDGISAVIAGLKKDVSYQVRVKAQNSDPQYRAASATPVVARRAATILTSDASDASTALAPTVAPGNPTGVMVTASNEKLAVSWTAPEMDGGLPLTYKVLWRELGQTEDTAFSESGIPGTSFTIPNLTNGTGYTVTVRAANEIGESDSSESRSATPMGIITAPGIPSSLRLENPTTTTVLVRWGAPASNGGSAVTGYSGSYRFGSGAETTFDAGATATTKALAFTSSTSPRTLTVTLMATNSAGMGASDTTQIQIPAAAAAVDDINNKLTLNREAVNSDTPGAEVRVRVRAKFAAEVGDSITIKLDKFGLPGSIAADKVSIRSNAKNVWYLGSPTDVSISGSTISMEFAALKGESDSKLTLNSLLDTSVTTITIQQGAGITNPNVAKEYPVELGSDKTHNVAVVEEEVSVKPASGSRGDEIVVSGKGFSAGAATVELGDKDRQAIASNVAITDGSFSATITVGEDFEPGANKINAKDSLGNSANMAATFTLKPKVTASPAEAAPTEEITIKVSDWSAGNITAIHFGGINIKQTQTVTDGKAEFKVNVPGAARIGLNTIALRVKDKTEGSVNVTVKALDLTIDPATVVPGQRVTITGTGFEKSKNVTEIKFGGKVAVLPETDDRASTSIGNIAYTVEVPLGVGHGEKDVEVTVGAKTAIGAVTVPEPEITVTPEVSAPGTVISVQGTGFASGLRIEVLYGSGIEAVGRADGNGAFTIRMDVPSDAGIGTKNKVKVQVRSALDINATADHKTPGSMITLPEIAQVGTRMTITGTNFEPFSVLEEVSVGGNNALPSPAPETDKNGAFSFEIRVPRLSPGSHTVTVKDGSKAKNSATETFTVTTTAVTYTPEEIFGDLIEAGVLASVWRYSIDATGSDWDSYDPRFTDEPGINDLEFVSRGDIVWIRVTENVMFQGATLYAGWNLITLE